MTNIVVFNLLKDEISVNANIFDTPKSFPSSIFPNQVMSVIYDLNLFIKTVT